MSPPTDVDEEVYPVPYADTIPLPSGGDATVAALLRDTGQARPGGTSMTGGTVRPESGVRVPCKRVLMKTFTPMIKETVTQRSVGRGSKKYTDTLNNLPRNLTLHFIDLNSGRKNWNTKVGKCVTERR